MLCGFDCISFGFKMHFENDFGNKRMWKGNKKYINFTFFSFGLVAWKPTPACSLLPLLSL
jgi:hypothetical protein